MVDILNPSPAVDQLVDFRRQARHGGHGFILGKPVSGITVTTQMEILSILRNSDDEVFVIDTEGSYWPLANQAEGQLIRMGSGHSSHVNPLNIPYSFSPNSPFYEQSVSEVIAQKADQINILFELLTGTRMKPYQSHLIYQSVKEVYDPFFTSKNDENEGNDNYLLPLLRDIYRVLRNKKTEDTDFLAACLQPCISGTMDSLSFPTNIQHSNRFVVYELKDIHAPFKAAALLSVLDNIWNHCVQVHKKLGKDKKIWIFLDDASALLKSKAAAEYLRILYMKAKSYGCILTCSTFNVSYLSEQTCRYILGLCDYIHMLALSAVDLKMLSSLFKIPPSQTLHIEDAPAFQALVWLDGDLAKISRDLKEVEISRYNFISGSYMQPRN